MSVTIQDVLYGSVVMPPLLVKVMDTPYFQRLSRLFQLGACHFIYPGATHTRKSHCMGAAHLAGVWMKHLARTQPELHVTDRMTSLVQLAALLHDIGHTFFSHLFDREIAPFLDIPRRDHEERSVHLLGIIARERKLGLTDTEVAMVASMITGKPPAERSSCWPDYLFQIVASLIDVDKMDYLRRDSYYTGVPCGFQADRLIFCSRVIDGQLCFNRKAARNILQLFHTRLYAHSEVYQQKTCMVISSMIADALKLARKELELERFFQHDTLWCDLDDFSVLTLIRLRCPEGHPSRVILDRIDNRDLYTKRVREEYMEKKGAASSEQAAAGAAAAGDKRAAASDPSAPPPPSAKRTRLTREDSNGFKEGVKQTDTRHGEARSRVGYTNHNVNPLTMLWFYDKSAPDTKYRLGPGDSLSHVLPVNFAEYRVVEFDRGDIEVPELQVLGTVEEEM